MNGKFWVKIMVKTVLHKTYTSRRNFRKVLHTISDKSPMNDQKTPNPIDTRNRLREERGV